jgi:hypothetical protein
MSAQPWIPRRILALGLAVGLLALGAAADVLHMKDGRTVEGHVLEETASVVRIKTVLGVLEFKRAEIERIERKKGDVQEYDERFARAKTGDEFHALGLWAEQKRMRKHSKQAMQQAVQVEPMHEAANLWLGNVLHEGRWMTPEERELLVAAAQEAEQRARGLVPYGGRWVTPEDKARLEQGLLLVDGEWLTFEESQRRLGLEEHEGRWIERTEALARGHCSRAEELAGLEFGVHVNEQTLVAGTVPADMLVTIGGGLLVGRRWFDQQLHVTPGLELLAGRRAEFYLFSTVSEPYEATLEYFAGLTPTLPEGWAAAAKNSFGFFWTDPWAMSSARQWHRGQEELVGHCFHHWGHMLLCRLGYDGRLLPPWYEEAFASLMEFQIHHKNAVFCRARTMASTGTVSVRTTRVFDPKMMRDGKWREALKLGIEADQVLSIDKLYQRDFSDLEVLDIATGMGILEWIDSHGPEALPKFHAIVRGSAPKSPARILGIAGERVAANELGFKTATGLGYREADRAWKRWFLGR